MKFWVLIRFESDFGSDIGLGQLKLKYKIFTFSKIKISNFESVFIEWDLLPPHYPA